MRTKKAQVIMLPAKQEGRKQSYNSSIYYDGKKLTKFNTTNSKSREQHLYITTDDEIKDGDWKIVNLHTIKQHKKGDFLPKFGSLHKKIIATTDKSLRINYTSHPTMHTTYLPQPSQAFIEEYCKVGGINEVMVEYSYGNCTHNSCYRDTNTDCKNICLLPKVDSHNNITIHPIKNSWSKEEVISLCRAAANDYVEVLTNEDNWIKENL